MEVACNGDKDEESVSLCVTHTITTITISSNEAKTQESMQQLTMSHVEQLKT